MLAIHRAFSGCVSVRTAPLANTDWADTRAVCSNSKLGERCLAGHGSGRLFIVLRGYDDYTEVMPRGKSRPAPRLSSKTQVPTSHRTKRLFAMGDDGIVSPPCSAF